MLEYGRTDASESIDTNKIDSSHWYIVCHFFNFLE